MDPLSITVSVSSLLVVTARIVKLINNVHGSYQDAAIVLASIASECAVIHASLAHLQNLILTKSHTLGPGLTPQVIGVFDTSLLGCALTFSVIDKEVQGLVDGLNPTKGLSGKKRIQFILEQDRLKELLTQVRGQQTSLTLLLAILQKSV